MKSERMQNMFLFCHSMGDTNNGTFRIKRRAIKFVPSMAADNLDEINSVPSHVKRFSTYPNVSELVVPIIR